MIISRTPLRVSFLGGGTDFPAFYKEHGGAVVSTAIDKYIYVIVKRRFDDKIVLHYTKTETGEFVDDIQHDLVREALKMAEIGCGIEITTLADIPSEGTGLGSSSSLTVGLLHALYTYRDIPVTPEKLAADACAIEIDILGKGIGKQDQYIAAFGGLRLLVFEKDKVSTVWIKRQIRRQAQEHFLLFYTGITRDASIILEEQKGRIQEHTEGLRRSVELVRRGLNTLAADKYDLFGSLMNEAWGIKKQYAGGVSNDTIEELRNQAIGAGALGCKICGAGGGGFLLVCCDEDKKEGIREALAGYQELPFSFDPKGSQIILREG